MVIAERPSKKKELKPTAEWSIYAKELTRLTASAAS
jgi:hypothetical protein